MVNARHLLNKSLLKLNNRFPGLGRFFKCVYGRTYCCSGGFQPSIEKTTGEAAQFAGNAPRLDGQETAATAQ